MSLRWDVLSTRGRCFHSLQIFYISTSLAVGVSFGPLPFLRAQQRSKKRSGEVASLGCFTDASTRNPTHSSDGRRSERFRHSECLKTDGFGRFMGSKTNRSPHTPFPEFGYRGRQCKWESRSLPAQHCPARGPSRLLAPPGPRGLWLGPPATNHVPRVGHSAHTAHMLGREVVGSYGRLCSSPAPPKVRAWYARGQHPSDSPELPKVRTYPSPRATPPAGSAVHHPAAPRTLSQTGRRAPQTARRLDREALFSLQRRLLGRRRSASCRHRSNAGTSREACPSAGVL